MLSYRHAFHAGNSADILKHSVLTFCLEYALQKEKPLLCIDTHAGAALYPLRDNTLSGGTAVKREWEQGLGKLLDNPGGRAETLPPMLRRLLEICFGKTDIAELPEKYPGSPLLMARLLRPTDRLVCCELHPADYSACATVLAAASGGRNSCRTEVRREDGFTALKGLLPPPQRRCLIFIDPPYEVKEDYRRVPETLTDALRRFETGTYIIWYPLLKNTPSAGHDFSRRILDLYRGNRCLVELYTARPDALLSNSPRGMYGSGLVIFNPPWTLAASLAESLPVLGSLVGIGEDGWKLANEELADNI
jgi:23S rRNA (adenine2030-N6)-methyltransferase